MKVFITGSAGFIGSHLYEKLKREGHEVKGMDDFSHPCKNYVIAEVYKRDVRKKKDIWPYVKWADVVYHLAAQIHVDKSIKDPKETVNVNVLGTLNVLEACRKYKKKLVFASSSEVYGTGQTEYMAETHALDAQSPYAASKVAGDRLCKSYIDTYGCDICILRNFNTFGPFQNDGNEGKSYGAVIGIFTRAALRSEPIQVFGSGSQERDYIYITDALKGYEIASTYTGVLNIGTGRTVSINELAEKIKTLCGSKSEIVHVMDRPGEVMRLCADISKAKTLGFIPSTNFDTDLRTYIEWYRKAYGYECLHEFKFNGIKGEYECACGEIK